MKTQLISKVVELKRQAKEFLERLDVLQDSIIADIKEEILDPQPKFRLGESVWYLYWAFGEWKVISCPATITKFGKEIINSGTDRVVYYWYLMEDSTRIYYEDIVFASYAEGLTVSNQMNSEKRKS